MVQAAFGLYLRQDGCSVLSGSQKIDTAYTGLAGGGMSEIIWKPVKPKIKNK